MLSAAFYDHFGPDRRFHQLAHDVAAKSPLLGLIRRYGVVPASHDNARAAFDLGAPVLVYPGGDYETFRPSWHGDKIEFGGRQGFIKLALERDVPIVPVVAIGGQETALFVTRGQRAAKLLGSTSSRASRCCRSRSARRWGSTCSTSRAASRSRPRSRSRCCRRSTCASATAPTPTRTTAYEEITAEMQDALSALDEERTLPVVG